MNPFSFIKQQLSPSYLGVDIGTTSIKIAEVTQGDNVPRLVNYGILESRSSLSRANTVFQTSSLKLFEKEISGILGTLVGTMKPHTKDAVASLPGFSAFMTVVDFPAMSDADLARAIGFKAKEYIPLPLSEVALDWLNVGSYEDEKGGKYVQILLISVPQEQIRKYQQIFRDAGLNLKALEIEGLSLVRALSAGDPTPTLIMDIGSRSTAAIIADHGILRFSMQSDFAGASITQSIASSLQINPLRAEEMKRERGMLGGGPTAELSTVMLPMLDAIINEVRRALHAYENQFYGARSIERIVLSGGGANLFGIQQYIGEVMGVPAVKAEPLHRFAYDGAIEPLVGELNPLLSVSLGLALREFV
jgi:type IV pilus assembly protein PilM